MRVVATVGTDHHPFVRLVGWCDRWAAAHPADEMTVQHGTADPPKFAVAHQEMAAQELAQLIADADAVVCHGGPATISEIRSAGKLPIVVPRSAALGEHVDDHQVRFVARLARGGMVRLAGSESELGVLLDAARNEPGSFLISSVNDPTEQSVQRYGDLLDALCR